MFSLVIKLLSERRPTYLFQDIKATQRIITNGKSLFFKLEAKLTCLTAYLVGEVIIRQHIAQIGLA
jgi:hypothetical protein